MPEPRSSRPHLPCSLVLKTTSDVSSLGLKCRAASAPCSSLHSRFIWNLPGTVGLRDQQPPCAGPRARPHPHRVPVFIAKIQFQTLELSWSSGVMDGLLFLYYRNPTPDEQGQ